MKAPRNKKLQIGGVVSMALGSVLALIVAVSRSYRADAFTAGRLDKDVWAAGDASLKLLMGLATLVFVAGCVTFLVGRFAKPERV